jgi:hypothetical protein
VSTPAPPAPPAQPLAGEKVEADWPVPVPDWFWSWARWYLGRGEFAEGPRREATRPAAAPRHVPGWAWRRLAVMAGAERVDAPQDEPASASPAWPVPIPSWFWAWAQWYLHRGHYAGAPAQSPSTRPATAPRVIPPWAWRRLKVLQAGTATRTP